MQEKLQSLPEPEVSQPDEASPEPIEEAKEEQECVTTGDHKFTEDEEVSTTRSHIRKLEERIVSAQFLLKEREQDNFSLAQKFAQKQDEFQDL